MAAGGFGGVERLMGWMKGRTRGAEGRGEMRAGGKRGGRSEGQRHSGVVNGLVCSRVGSLEELGILRGGRWGGVLKRLYGN